VDVIDLRNTVLWSIGLSANRHRIPPHQISLCPLLGVMPRVENHTKSNKRLY